MKLKKWTITGIDGNILYDGFDYHIACKVLQGPVGHRMKETWWLCEVPSDFDYKNYKNIAVKRVKLRFTATNI